jgi:uncharacterized protein YndB with AHSA1/START domain
MHPFFETAAVDQPSDSAVRVRRSFKAPRELLWRAHTEPELLQRWCQGMPGWTMPVCEMDVQVGGAYLWRWRRDEGGEEFGFHGAFSEVDAPSCLAYTQFFDPGDVGGDMGEGCFIRNTFEESGGVTTMTVFMDFHTKEARDAAVATGMTDGMEMSYARLDDLIAKHVS